MPSPAGCPAAPAPARRAAPPPPPAGRSLAVERLSGRALVAHGDGRRRRGDRNDLRPSGRRARRGGPGRRRAGRRFGTAPGLVGGGGGDGAAGAAGEEAGRQRTRPRRRFRRLGLARLRPLRLHPAGARTSPSPPTPTLPPAIRSSPSPGRLPLPDSTGRRSPRRKRREEERTKTLANEAATIAAIDALAKPAGADGLLANSASRRPSAGQRDVARWRTRKARSSPAT